MSVTLFVRDTKELEQLLQQGNDIDSIMPNECWPNAELLFGLMQYVPAVFPKFSDISKTDQQKITKAAAFVMDPG